MTHHAGSLPCSSVTCPSLCKHRWYFVIQKFERDPVKQMMSLEPTSCPSIISFHFMDERTSQEMWAAEVSQLLQLPPLPVSSQLLAALPRLDGLKGRATLLPPPARLRTDAQRHEMVCARSQNQTWSRTRTQLWFQPLPLPRAHLQSESKRLPEVVVFLLPALDKEEFKCVGWEMQFPASGIAGELWKAAACKRGENPAVEFLLSLGASSAGIWLAVEDRDQKIGTLVFNSYLCGLAPKLQVSHKSLLSLSHSMRFTLRRKVLRRKSCLWNDTLKIVILALTRSPLKQMKHNLPDSQYFNKVNFLKSYENPKRQAL